MTRTWTRTAPTRELGKERPQAGPLRPRTRTRNRSKHHDDAFNFQDCGPDSVTPTESQSGPEAAAAAPADSELEFGEAGPQAAGSQSSSVSAQAINRDGSIRVLVT
jgi:hypothetical protein